MSFEDSVTKYRSVYFHFLDGLLNNNSGGTLEDVLETLNDLSRNVPAQVTSSPIAIDFEAFKEPRNKRLPDVELSKIPKSVALVALEAAEVIVIAVVLVIVAVAPVVVVHPPELTATREYKAVPPPPASVGDPLNNCTHVAEG